MLKDISLKLKDISKKYICIYKYMFGQSFLGQMCIWANN